MALSSSDSDDGSLCSPPATQHSAYDAGLDLTNTLRLQKDAQRRRREEQMARRREERRLQIERKRQQFAQYEVGDGDNSLSSGGSDDLLAEASPAAPSSSPSPGSPPRTRISNRGGRGLINGASESNRSGWVDSQASASKKNLDMSPSSILKHKRSDPSPSHGNSVAWRFGKSRPKDNGRKPWKPMYDSDSGGDEVGDNREMARGLRGRPPLNGRNNTNTPCNAMTKSSPPPRKKPHARSRSSITSDSDDQAIAAEESSSVQRMYGRNEDSKRWKPKYDSGSEDDKVCDQEQRVPDCGSQLSIDKNDVDIKYNAAVESHSFQTKKTLGRNDDTSHTEDAMKPNGRRSELAGAVGSYKMSQVERAAKSLHVRRKWGSSDDSESGDGRSLIQRHNHSGQEAPRVTRDLMKARTAPLRRFGSDSDSSDDDSEYLKSMREGIRARREEADRMKAAAASRSRCSAPAHGAVSTLSVKKSESSRRPATAPKRSRFASSDSDSDGDSLAVIRQKMIERGQATEARLRAEKEASYKHNPLAVERRERDERKERERRVAEENRNATLSVGDRGSSARTAPGAGVLEGTEIAVGDYAEAGSVSDMGDGIRGRGSFSTEKQDLSRKPSQGSHGGEDDSDEENRRTKKQRCSPTSLQKRGGRNQLSDDDGLWDDSDVDDHKKKNNSDDSDSGSGSGTKKTYRGRRRRKGGREVTQVRKRSRSKTSSKKASKSDGSSCDDSNVPTQKKKATARKNGPRKRHVSSAGPVEDDTSPKRRSSNGAGRWASRFTPEDGGDKSVSEDELERMEQQLKPKFDDPKLGPPSALLPFALSKTWERGDPLTSHEETGNDQDGHQKGAVPAGDNGDIDRVPASINRYLQDYQRTGIQFMYSSIMHGKGCVLGDDMGLGKTVQLISLVAALLKKTGTAMDEYEIIQHRKKTKKILNDREESKHRALLMGVGIKNEPSALVAIELPKFTPILVVVPPSVIENWQNEFQTWGHFNVGVYQGAARERALDRIKHGLDFILIVGKTLFIRASDYDQIAAVSWKLVIIDEFHEFKNGKSQGYMRLADLRDNSGCPLIGMTGTLMQNNHDELYYLIDLIRPDSLGDIKEFKNEISKPLTYARAKDAKEEVMQLGERQEQLLRRLIKPAYLERKKEDVLKDSLTEKKERVIFCELSGIQKKIYRHILSLPDFELLRFANAPCDCGVNRSYFMGYKKMRTQKEQLNYQRRHKKDLIPKKKCCFRYPFNPRRDEPGEPQVDPDALLWIQAHEKPIGNPDDIVEDVLDDCYIVCQNCPMCIALAAMSKLYKISSHPALLQVDRCETGPGAKKKLEFAKLALTPDIVCEMPGGTHWKNDGIMDNHIVLSGKMKSLDYLLRRYLKRQNRVLVFSYSTASLDLIQNHIKTQGWTNVRLDGQTPTSQRQSLVNQFQKGDIEIFLISTKAGGLGLNLTRANKVIIFDVNWNPSYDEQAQDRAYRIGQKRNVETVRLVARGTIEELMYARQVYKVQLKKQTLGHNTDGKNQPQIFRGVAKDPNRKGELFGLENLMKFKDGSFMASLWKKADDSKEEHDMNDLAKEFENIDDEKLENLVEKGDEGPKDTRIRQKTHQNECNDDEYSTSDNGDAEGVNHGAYFSSSKGRAKVGRDDEGFDVEMGGESQILAVASKIACEGLPDTGDEREASGNETEPNSPGYHTHKPFDTSFSLKSKAPHKPGDKKKSVASDGGGEGTMDAKPDYDESIDDPLPIHAQNTVKGNDCSGASPNSGSENLRDNESQEKHSPDCSTADQSTGSPERLKTQPTQPPIAKRKEKKTTTKVSIMGNIFENTKRKKVSGGGIYIPKYSRKSNNRA